MALIILFYIFLQIKVMKIKVVSIVLLTVFVLLTFISAKWKVDPKQQKVDKIHTDRILRHVVLFKFKEGTSVENINKVEAAFNALPSKIKEIQDFEWGINNSPEGLDKGFTHCFLLTFKSEEDRAIYLPHPNHKAFGEVLTPYLEDVLVIDYWSK